MFKNVVAVLLVVDYLVCCLGFKDSIVASRASDKLILVVGYGESIQLEEPLSSRRGGQFAGLCRNSGCLRGESHISINCELLNLVVHEAS